ncbi:probable alpha,alpha-trehalose-phosphate synthase [UDP-forming] 10 [Phragmites australis]|uniref:probable alpha,alpha-trehalose-phosphate synthase [UDP-forming] 10 n=1 Tax=Phragmites australis TaxID=29695 RepID=UPI002D7844FE|nr:probable alpha,alpha-trehalose-phosphate synthase [UDP-forming] 10 [Phragmites australis]XP_062198702.1 probable alpha,alpha-trehalose-phosphate synthase [UDP-forming] 10 [Phragmites australis]
MVLKSYSNLLDMSSEDVFDFQQPFRSLPRVVTSPGIISNPDWETNTDVDSIGSAPSCLERKIVVANFLPLNCTKDEATGQWSFAMDDNQLIVQLKDGFPIETEVVYVGSLKVHIDPSEQDQISQKLFKEHKCIPTFLPADLQQQFYHSFCKQQLWPLFHYMLPICHEKGELFDRSLFQAYVRANKIFADKVMEAINSDDDCVWVHDYHLMLVPTFLRKKLHRIKVGFFLHSPFPSSEIYRTLPVRDEILKSLLNADLIGFQTFDYARHFLSCCSRLLGLNYESKRGHIGIEYFGRTVSLKILAAGVHVGRLESMLKLPATVRKVQEIENRYKGKLVMLGVDDMDIFKGISLKLLGLELLLERTPKLRGKVVLVQIINPARSTGKDVEEAINEAISVAERINDKYGSVDYKPVVLIDYPIPSYEKIAFYAASDCCIVNAVRDGMNLIPYEYTVCRQGNEEIDQLRGVDKSLPHTSTLIVSEFVGCSPSLSGAFRVNPWSVEDVADALYSAADLTQYEKKLRHEKHYRYVRSHDVAYWARSFSQDLERACKEHYSRRCWITGFGLNFRVIALSPGFRRLSQEHFGSSYKKANRRVIFLDYDGTLVPQSALNKAPNAELISILNRLCNDPKNIVFIVSGRGRDSLSEWFASCENLGIAAEHGYFTRWNKAAEWETSSSGLDSEWKHIAEPVMHVYEETTDGSFIERKESALVWHYQNTDHDFGSCQAKELAGHLERVLANEPVVVKRGHQIVEVKPQGISKGIVVDKIIQTLVNNGEAPDFLMCIGNDRSDEDMFESINNATSNVAFPANPEVFACSVGRKASKAKYYVDGCCEVIRLLKGVTAISSRKDTVSHSHATFNDMLEVASRSTSN